MKSAPKFIAALLVAASTAACADSYGPDPRGPDHYAAGPSGGPYGDQGDQRWRHRYARTYSYNDDTFYQQCRTGPDPAAVIAGGLIGGLIGNALGSGGGRAGATVAGVVVGGAIGAGLTSGMDCEDRSYAYKSYYDGFNSNRADSDFEWRNDHNGHHGRFRVDSYYADPDGFRCATYHQTIYIDGQARDSRGHACRQPDGSWAVVD
jgi:surface antigen